MFSIRQLFILGTLLVLVASTVSSILDRINPLYKKSISKPDNQTADILDRKNPTSDLVNQVFEMLGRTRKEHKVADLKLDSRLTRSAQRYADQIPKLMRLHRADYLTKKAGIDNSTTKGRMEAQGIKISDLKRFDEIILAEPTSDVSKLEKGIKGDPEVLDNILSADIVGIGISQIPCQDVLDIGDMNWFKSTCQMADLNTTLFIVVLDWASLEVREPCPECQNILNPNNIIIIEKPTVCCKCGQNPNSLPPNPQSGLQPVVTLVTNTIHQTGITQTYYGVTPINQPIQVDLNDVKKVSVIVEMKPVQIPTDN